MDIKYINQIQIMSSEENDTIFELYKLSSVVLPEKGTWSIDEISAHLYPNSKLQKTETVDRLKVILKKLEEKQAIIFINGFESFNLVKSKLLELMDVSKLNK
jgi:hypothetical protein